MRSQNAGREAARRGVSAASVAARGLLLLECMQAPTPIIVFAGIRWVSLPALSERALVRLAKDRSVFFLESPKAVEVGEREFWELNCGAPDLLVCRPRIAGLEDADPHASTRMARALLGWLDIDEFVAWIYSAAVFDAVVSLSPSLVIHDRSLEATDPAAANVQVYGPSRRRKRRLAAPHAMSAMRFTPLGS